MTLVVAPLFHIGGLNVTTLVTWQRGGEVVLHRSFDPAACLEDIARYGVTTMFGVPAMFLFMSQLPAFNDADLTTLRMLVCGGAPVPEPLIKLYNGRGHPHQPGLRAHRDGTDGQLPLAGVGPRQGGLRGAAGAVQRPAPRRRGQSAGRPSRGCTARSAREDPT